MAVTVSLNRAHLQARINNDKERVGQALAEQILADCNNTFIPLDSSNTGGDLMDSGRVEKINGSYSATWDTPYAAYQYYGVRRDGTHVIKDHDDGKHEKATILWCEVAKFNHGKDWEKIAQKTVDGKE